MYPMKGIHVNECRLREMMRFILHRLTTRVCSVVEITVNCEKRQVKVVMLLYLSVFFFFFSKKKNVNSNNVSRFNFFCKKI